MPSWIGLLVLAAIFVAFQVVAFQVVKRVAPRDGREAPMRTPAPPTTPRGIAFYVLVVTVLYAGLWTLATLPGSGISWEGLAVAVVGGLLFAGFSLWLVHRLAGQR